MTTEDTLYQGRVHLVQPQQGFRAGTDSLLLAAAVACRSGGEALEIGCGCGGVLLPAAWRMDDVRLTGLDLDQALSLTDPPSPTVAASVSLPTARRVR